MTTQELQAKSYSLLYRFMDKVLSARFLVTLIVAFTLKYAVTRSFDMIYICLTNANGVDKDTVVFVKEIFLYVMGVFSGIIGTVFASYFARQDRMKNHNEEFSKT